MVITKIIPEERKKKEFVTIIVQTAIMFHPDLAVLKHFQITYFSKLLSKVFVSKIIY